MKRERWEWYGLHGHFICGRWCRFHLNTYVGRWVVSTVGELIPPSVTGGSAKTEHEWLQKNWPGMDVGAGRKYETMVFKAGARCDNKDCDCNAVMIASGQEVDFLPANTRGEAQKNHMALCKKWAGRKSAK